MAYALTPLQKQQLRTFYLNKTIVHLVGPFCKKPISEGLYVDTKAKNHGISIGDGDSASPLDIEVKEKNDISDLALALRTIPKNIQKIYLHGFLGGRLDHEFFNLGEVHQYLRKRSHHIAKFDHLVFGLSTGLYQCQYKGVFSCFTFAPTTVIFTGTKYAGPISLKAGSSLGLSNVSKKTWTILCKKPVFLYLALDLPPKKPISLNPL